MEKMLDIATGIARAFIRNEDDRAYRDIVDLVTESMQSEFGIVGYIDKDGNLVNASYTTGIWESCKIPGKKVKFGRDCWVGVWGESLVDMETKIKNEGPFNFPEGHIPIYNFLCSPIVFKSEVIGIISVANKKEGYGKDDIKLIEMICQTMAPILHEKLEREKTLGLLKQTRKAIFDMLNYANMYVLILDSSMRVKFINKSLVNLLGFERIRDVMGKCWLDFIEPEEQERITNIHHHIIMGTPESEDFTEVKNIIVNKDGKKMNLRWFNTQINTKYHWSFSIAIPDKSNVLITEESIRSYYEDVIKQDRTMIISLRDTIMNKTKRIIDSCEPGDGFNE